MGHSSWSSQRNSRHRRGRSGSREQPPPYSRVVRDPRDAAEHMVNEMLKLSVGQPDRRLVIAVARGRGFAHQLEEELSHKTKKPSVWKRWFKGGKSPEPPCPMIITTRKHLERTIECVDEDLEELILLVHEDVDEIAFHVEEENVTKLIILQCARDRDGLPTIVDGASTFCGVRLDEWTGLGGESEEDRRFYTGERGICIKLDPRRPGSVFSNPQTWRGMSAEQVRAVQSIMADAERRQQQPGNGGGDWARAWRGPAAAVLGLAAGVTAKVKVAAAAKASQTGLLLGYSSATRTFGFARNLAQTSVTFLGTGTCTAVLTGLAVGAVAYFIPWEHVFGFIGSFVCKVAEYFKSAWDWFWNWVWGWFSWFDTWVKSMFGNLPAPPRISM
ncbi:hypothetical protein RB595_004874 [Gaeumannomyces hyphopodioides]